MIQGVILLTENFARTISPMIGATIADRWVSILKPEKGKVSYCEKRKFPIASEITLKNIFSIKISFYKKLLSVLKPSKDIIDLNG